MKRRWLEKNRAVVKMQPENNLSVISADTSVVLNGQILGKPESAEQAIEMLSQLSGCVHQVLARVCVSFNGAEFSAVQQNDVQFREISAAEMAAYVATGEPLDKAGAYGIQGLGGVFVSHLSGSFTGVMGLPVFETVELLRRCGVKVPPFQTV